MRLAVYLSRMRAEEKLLFEEFKQRGLAYDRIEERIIPEQIGDYKVTLHRHFMQHWVNANAEKVRGRSFEDVWRIREECSAALAQ